MNSSRKFENLFNKNAERAWLILGTLQLYRNIKLSTSKPHMNLKGAHRILRHTFCHPTPPPEVHLKDIPSESLSDLHPLHTVTGLHNKGKNSESSANINLGR